jgi:hypothetical protein
LIAFRGKEGLSGYERMQGAFIDTPTDFFNLDLDCVMLSYGPRESLQEEELRRIQELGLVFRGKSHWPRFRDFTPGRPPWPVGAYEELRLMKEVLDQAMDVARRQARNTFLLSHDMRPGMILLRKPRLRQGKWQWEDVWYDPDGPQPAHPPAINKLFMRSNLASLPRQQAEWLADVFYLPVAIGDPRQGRPTFPYMLIVADAANGAVLGYAAMDPREAEAVFQQQFVRIVNRIGYLPQQLWVTRSETLVWFSEIADILGLPLGADKQNAYMQDIKNTLFGSFSL